MSAWSFDGGVVRSIPISSGSLMMRGAFGGSGGEAGRRGGGESSSESERCVLRRVRRL